MISWNMKCKLFEGLRVVVILLFKSRTSISLSSPYLYDYKPDAFENEILMIIQL